MKFSFSLLFSGIFIAYVLHSIYSIAQIFLPPGCGDEGKVCIKSFLETRPQLQLLLVTTPSELTSYSQLSEKSLIDTWSPLNYQEDLLTKYVTYRYRQ